MSLAQITFWFQRLTFVTLLTLASFGRVAPTLSLPALNLIAASTDGAEQSVHARTDGAQSDVKAQSEHKAQQRGTHESAFHRSSQSSEPQWQAVDERAVYEPELSEPGSGEDDALDFALIPNAPRAGACDDELVLRAVALTHTAQRLVELARPRGPPRA